MYERFVDTSTLKYKIIFSHYLPSETLFVKPVNERFLTFIIIHGLSICIK